MKKLLDAKALASQAANNWSSIFARLSPAVYEASQRGHRVHVDCPIPGHGSPNDFRVFKDFEETGGCICTCGSYTTGFSVLMAVNGWTFRETLEEVDAVLNGGSSSNVIPMRPVPAKPKVSPEKEVSRIRANLIRAAKASKPALDVTFSSRLWVYFQNRGLWPTEEMLQDLRFAPKLTCFENKRSIGDFPAMIGVVRNVDGNWVTLHRTYLNQACTGKAPVLKAKKLMESVKDFNGAAIRTGPVREVLGVAEGIETALAVSMATGSTCWSTISASILGNFIPPEGVKRLVIWADKDRSGAGETYAVKLQKRMAELGIPTVIMLPEQDIPTGKKSIDWLDVFLAQSQEIPSIEEVSYG